MRKSLKEMTKKSHREMHSKTGALFKEFILGGQDGLVNVLGVILGIAVATSDPRIVIVAGLAAAFAESFSMAAVAYTSSNAEKDYYFGQKKVENYEIKNFPKREEKEIYDIYYKKGFRGKLLKDLVKKTMSNKKMWLDLMMKDELGLSKEFIHPIKSAFVVGLAAIIGSIIPLMAFFFFPIKTAIIIGVILSAITLFITGALEAKFTIGNWFRKGIELTIIGLVAAGIGFVIGKLVGI